MSRSKDLGRGTRDANDESGPQKQRTESERNLGLEFSLSRWGFFWILRLGWCGEITARGHYFPQINQVHRPLRLMTTSLRMIAACLFLLGQFASAQQPHEAIMAQLKAELDGEFQLPKSSDPNELKRLPNERRTFTQSVFYDQKTNALLICRLYADKSTGALTVPLAALGDIPLIAPTDWPESKRPSQRGPGGFWLAAKNDQDDFTVFVEDGKGAINNYQTFGAGIFVQTYPSMLKCRELLIRLRGLTSRTLSPRTEIISAGEVLFMEFLKGVASELGRKVVR